MLPPVGGDDGVGGWVGGSPEVVLLPYVLAKCREETQELWKYPFNYFSFLLRNNRGEKQKQFPANWKANHWQLSRLMSPSCLKSCLRLQFAPRVSEHAALLLLDLLVPVFNFIDIYLLFFFYCTSCGLSQRVGGFASSGADKLPTNSLSHLCLTLIDNQTSLHIRHLWDQRNYLFNITQLCATLVHQSALIPHS